MLGPSSIIFMNEIRDCGTESSWQVDVYVPSNILLVVKSSLQIILAALERQIASLS